MSEIYLIRHGQASYGTSNYDQLSDLGIQQSQWLGEYFRSKELRPSTLMSGTLKRHEQTVQSMLGGLEMQSETIADSCWNEFDFETLVKLYLNLYPNDMPSPPSRSAFLSLMRKAIRSWAAEEIKDSSIETWQTFSDRLHAGLEQARNKSGQGPVIVITSGGSIAMLLRNVLGLDVDRMIDLNMQIKNTSITELYSGSHKAHLVGFNHMPHLDTEDRQAAITMM